MICESLTYNKRFVKILNPDRSVFSQDEALKKTHNDMLSPKPLSDKLAFVQNDRHDVRLRIINSLFKKSNLCGTNALYEVYGFNFKEYNSLSTSTS